MILLWYIRLFGAKTNDQLGHSLINSSKVLFFPSLFIHLVLLIFLELEIKKSLLENEVS